MRFQDGLAAVALVLLGLAGCTTLPQPERDSLVQASAAYQRGDCAGATTRVDRIIHDYPRAKEIGEAYYIRGLCRMKAGQTQAAAEDFEKAIHDSNRQDLVARSRASLAAIAYKQGDWNRAAELYMSSVPDLPDEPPTDQILYFAGVALQRAGKWREASFQLARVLKQFRNRPVANDARQLAAWPHEYFTIQLGAFANPQAATKELQSFRSKKLEAVQENLPRRGNAMWVVMVGRYPTYAEAAAALPQVSKAAAGAFIIPQD